ncbi:MAG: hypothetical protein IGS03_09815 [Candidatus Sericytochromatia bacterium]|nr:hypothetical protein [Candidatus Sericytochromatia bacterium]
MAALFTPAELPAGFVYPQGLIDLAQSDQGLSGSWWLIGQNPAYARLCLAQLQQRSPHKPLVPFAKNDDEEVLACFDGEDRSDNPRVYFDTFSNLSTVNWAQRYSLSFSEWLALALSD